MHAVLKLGVLALPVSAAQAGAVYGQELPGYDPSVLAGVSAVRLGVIASSYESTVTETALAALAREVVTDELAAAGVAISDTSPVALLAVVTALATPDGVAYLAHLQIWERVDRLRSETQEDDFALTWRSGAVPSWSSRSTFLRHLEETLGAHARLFVSEHRAGNPGSR